MRVRAVRQGSITLPGEAVRRRFFDGQTYDLPEEVVAAHDWLVPLDEPVVRDPEEQPQRPRRRG